VRQALYLLRTQSGSWRELSSRAITMDGPFGDHLRHLSWGLNPEHVLQLARTTLEAPPQAPPKIFKRAA
jgi:hypothetical protein